MSEASRSKTCLARNLELSLDCKLKVGNVCLHPLQAIFILVVFHNEWKLGVLEPLACLKNIVPLQTISFSAVIYLDIDISADEVIVIPTAKRLYQNISTQS